ncbi:Mov34/MPN/PAD-1 family protein [Brevundimonas aveniformis]|uniref:Mov34/MPN/PAD-1 family protein n=1 Tax=Brevundimonas aveniformis TaxID=370977 RepID=UPI000683DF29|nr:Mov34/MPN/PAD-1 family protein [Brevundimonas aveniformis]
MKVPAPIVDQTFAQLRRCGAGVSECQALWLGPWSEPDKVTEMIHPQHSASPVGFQVDPVWLHQLWLRLAKDGLGIRVQIHTHPGAAYHSATDDAYPIVHQPGFLSLVIPRFATGTVGFDQAFLARIDDAGTWGEVAIPDYLEVT